MTNDKYSAVWVSFSSISDYLTCPRAYFLKNIYKDPKTGHKIQLMTPALALGQAVHEVIESLSTLAVDVRFDESLIVKFDKAWQKISGKRGGFLNEKQEYQYKKRGQEMLRRLYRNPGPLKNLAVKIKMDLPHYWLSREERIILCGKIDWLEYLPDSDSVHIIDFKTGQTGEEENPLQLAIYYLLASNCQERPVVKASYWYLDHYTQPSEVELPDSQKMQEKILRIAKKIKLARQLHHFKCQKQDGCPACRPMEKVLGGEAEFIGSDEFKRDVYLLHDSLDEDQNGSTIL